MLVHYIKGSIVLLLEIIAGVSAEHLFSFVRFVQVETLRV